MQIILLSGGSGKRLWPLSNDARSKQFLKLLSAPDGSRESMVQRIFRQIKESGVNASLTVATSVSQYDSIVNQLGCEVDVVTEPERRDTFPAIALAVTYLAKEKQCGRDEVVVVMPSDSYVDAGYFDALSQMSAAVETNTIDMALMGIKPTEPSTKFGYIVPRALGDESGLIRVERFTEKPDEQTAIELLRQNAFWNGGVFAFHLGYMLDIVENYVVADSFAEVRSRYAEFPKISFDYEVVEKATSIGLVPYNGSWSDLGTWNSLASKISNPTIGNVIIDNSTNTHVVNETALPVVCLGVEGLIVAASSDGILVSSKEASVGLKSYADRFVARPMYEELLWGTYRVMGSESFDDGSHATTRLLEIKARCSIEVRCNIQTQTIWTIVDGEGVVLHDSYNSPISRGAVIHINSGQTSLLRAITDLKIIELQIGDNSTEGNAICLNSVMRNSDADIQ